MIKRFREVVPGKLYRGSAPTPKDIEALKNKIGIKKIVSLDKMSGDRIDRICKLLGITHIKMYIENDKTSLLHFLSQDLRKLFLEDGPTFVHCHEGCDRTGLACALVKCKFFGMSPISAIEEVKSLGFGIGIPENTTKLYERIIKSCKPVTDINNADIVSIEREYVGDNRDGPLDEGHQGSFAPFLYETKQAPMDYVYNFINDQSPTRENYQTQQKNNLVDDTEKIITNAPLVGQYNNDAGVHGVGPTEPVGGFLSD